MSRLDLPNIVMITTHDIGQQLHCYGARTVQSENLDQLAQRGVRFSHAFSTAPQCSPARAALATGRYPHANGVMGLAHDEFAWHLPPSETHLAEHLQHVGYQTVLYGLQHVTSTAKVRKLGFEEAYTDDTRTTVADRVVEWIEGYGQKPFRKPFYLEIGFADTHTPWNTHLPDWTKGTERPRWLPPYPGSDAEMAAFQGQVFAVDRAVGKIVQALETHGLLNNTWLIFTSDHGVALPRAKGTLYDPGIEIPLIMFWPHGGIDGGRVWPSLVSHVDVVPTILDALGLVQHDQLQGQSLWPLLTGKSYVERKEIFAEKTYHTTYDPIRAIRTPTHKFIMHFNTYDIADVTIDGKASGSFNVLREELTRQHQYVELYNLVEDPLERVNIAFEDVSRMVVMELMQRLRDWMEATDDPLLHGMVSSPTSRRALRLIRDDFALRQWLEGTR